MRRQKAPTKTDQGPTQETKTEDQESEEVSWTEADAAVAVAGMDDVTVVQGANEPNLLHGITYDGDIVENIEAQSDMDLDTPGTYKVTYQVTVNAEKLAEYLTVDDASTESVVEEQEDLDPEAEKKQQRTIQISITHTPWMNIQRLRLKKKLPWSAKVPLRTWQTKIGL